MLGDFEFVGWESDASGYGVVRAKDGKQRVLVEISTDYFDDLTVVQAGRPRNGRKR